MDFLFKIWPFVEDIGAPLLGILAALTWGSLIFYFRACQRLASMGSYIEKHQTTQGYKREFMLIGVTGVVYGFTRVTAMREKALGFKHFQEQVDSIAAFRRIYRYLIPILIVLVAGGIAINELIIDKH